MKKCNTCKEELEENKFKKPSSENCSQCLKERKERHEYKLKVRDFERDNLSNGIIRYLKHIKRHYKVSLDWYFDKLESQNGKCPICDKIPKLNEFGRESFCVDHNHGTKQVRGLLCNNCNTLIGFSLENPHLLERAIKYLKKYNIG